MSADSPRRSGSRMTRQGGGSVCGSGGGQVIVPQPVTDPSIIDSVTGFINDVVPQAYTNTLPGDCKETISWARFESADINDPAIFPDNTSDTVLPLILILGYNSGVQVWAIPANGEATEVLSWSQGSVRTLRILPSPTSNHARCSDSYAIKRPLVAICDSAGPGPPFCSVSFISLKTGDQVKSIKFKNPVCDVYANRRSVIITFPERIAVFDACTLEDRLSITSCYPSPGPNANPVALGSRWLAFAEKKLTAWQRSSGGVGGAGAQSYTATVLHAAQTLGRGLRGLSESVASSLTGPRNHIGGQMGILGSSPPTANGTDHNTPGIVTVLDVEASTNRFNSAEEGQSGNSSSADGVIAHFIAHNEAIVALEFDPSGTLLLTADKRGHDFHVFRLQPHPSGSSLAAVHHLYILHRGDTTAKVQNVTFSCDSRWVAVSTMRGTTHVFPLTPYGGPVGFRTHGSPLVVNRLSRFHRSAGLSADGRSSPVPSPESPPCLPAGPHANPRLPPYPHPAVQAPLSQLRQSPHPPLAPAGALDVSLRVCAVFASPRAWLLDSQTAHPRDGPRDSSKVLRRAVDSLFVMASHGNLVQYDLDPKPVIIGPREKICDDTQIELDVEAKAQWPLQRSPHSPEVLPPLPSSNPLLCIPEVRTPSCDSENNGQIEERWLSQVEIVTHAGPHRRLWMGPQITFKTYTTGSSGSNVLLQDVEAVEVGTVPVSRPARSNPVNMPSGGRPIVPVLIESGSGSSFEQSPHLLEVYGADSGDADHWGGHGDSRLREDLADAMLESPGAPSREKGKRRYYGLVGGGGGDGGGEGRVVRGGGNGPVRRVVNPGGAEITMLSDGEESDVEQHDLLEHHWEAIAIPATAPIIPVPPAPDSDSSPRQVVTTIAAARLQRLPVQLVNEIPLTTTEKRVSDKGIDVHSNNSEVGGIANKSNLQRKTVGGAAEKEIQKSRQSSSEASGKEKQEEKIEPHGREGSVDKSSLPVGGVKEKGEKGTESSEPPPIRKKNKKFGLTRDSEVSDKVVVDNYVGLVESTVSDSVIKYKNDRDSSKSTELLPMSGKRGKKTSAAQDDISDTSAEVVEKSLHKKSPSPAKEVIEIKSVKSALVSDKSGLEDSPSTAVKKNKKKSASKENCKKDGHNLESLAVENCRSVQADIFNVSELNNDLSTAKDDVQLKEDYDVVTCSNSVLKLSAEHNCDLLLTIKSGSSPEVEPGNSLDQPFTFNKDGAEFKVSLDEELPPHNSSKSRLKSLKSQQCSAEFEPNQSDVKESEAVSLTLSRNSRRSSKKSQNVDEELFPPMDCTANDTVSDKVDTQVANKLAKKNTKVEREANSSGSDTLVLSPQKEIAVKIKGKKSCQTVEQVSADSDLKDESLKAAQKDLSEKFECEVVALAAPLRKCYGKGIDPKCAEGGNFVSSSAAMDGIVGDSPERVTKKGQKSAKSTIIDVDSTRPSPKRESEPVTANIWNVVGDVGTPKDKDNFPALSSKYSKKARGISSEETLNSSDIHERQTMATEILKSSDYGAMSSELVPFVVGESDAVKGKRGWEIPVKVVEKSHSSDMDIDKLTFEDLEAIVDAACKEEESKIDQTCLKENKKEKRNDTSGSPHLKTKGKENFKSGACESDSAKDLIKVIEVPKPQEEDVKLEELVKSPEKPAPTVNRSSKAQRRKRR